MRPGVGVKPKDRAVIYSDAPSGFTISLGSKSSTGYVKITWWDGTSIILSKAQYISSGKSGKIDPAYSTDPRLYIGKLSNTNSTKKIIIESCDVNGNISGYLIYFTCQKKRKFWDRDPTTECNPLEPNQKIKQIDVSTCTNLKVLKCDRNNLTSLGDINACKQLSTLCCGGNSFASLDVSKIPNLEQLYCNSSYNLNSITIGSKLKIFASSRSGFTGFVAPSGSQLVQVIFGDSALIGITLDNCSNLSLVELGRAQGIGVCNTKNPFALKSISANNVPKLSYLSSAGTTLTNSISLTNSGEALTSDITVGNKLITSRGPYNYYYFGEATLSAAQLNTIYSGLNTLSVNYISLGLYSTSGYTASNTTIFTSKGWVA